MLTQKPQAVAGVSSNYENVLEEIYPSVGKTAIGWFLNALYESLPGFGEIRLSYLLFVPPTWPLGLLAYVWLKITGSKYVVTNRAVKRFPVLGIRLQEEALLEQVEQISVDPDSRLAFFRSGDVRLTGANGSTLMLLRGVPYPDRLVRVIEEVRFARQQTESSLTTIRGRK